MKRLLYITLIFCALSFAANASSRKYERARKQVIERGEGYYKDIFMDSGIALTSRTYLPSARFLGLDIEYFASALKKNLTAKDTL